MDLLIAVSALLISTLAMAASWLQSRETARQTQVLEQQLSAQVWPYVGVSSGVENDTVSVSIENDGLGPAVLRNLTVAVDGKPRSDFGEVLHALLGPDLRKRKPRGEHMSVHMDATGVGSVLRPGASIALLSFASKRYSAPLGQATRRIDVSLCYCAIIPEKCWQNESATDAPPKPVEFCPEVPHDILHANMTDSFKRL